MSSRHVVIAGAGIAGLTLALTLASRGLRTTILEQAEALQEAGAGLQLSPNATRILLALGLGERLAGRVVEPAALVVREARTGRPIARLPLGEAGQRHGAPYWLLHRADLQQALAEAAADAGVALKLGTRLEDFAEHGDGVAVAARRGGDAAEERGIAVIGADGLWSRMRRLLHGDQPPRSHQRVAYRATVPADAVEPQWRAHEVQLWLGDNAHLVHYPVRGGTLINIVAIIRDGWQGQSWSAAAHARDVLANFMERRWAASARSLLGQPQAWAKWALFDRAPLPQLGRGAATLVGDAAHPMLPFLAQGAAMAIEDAAVLAACLAQESGVPPALRRYEAARRDRTARVQAAALGTGTAYHHAGLVGTIRNTVMRGIGGEKMLRRYDWIYAWRPQT